MLFHFCWSLNSFKAHFLFSSSAFTFPNSVTMSWKPFPTASYALRVCSSWSFSFSQTANSFSRWPLDHKQHSKLTKEHYFPSTEKPQYQKQNLWQCMTHCEGLATLGTVYSHDAWYLKVKRVKKSRLIITFVLKILHAATEFYTQKKWSKKRPWCFFFLHLEIQSIFSYMISLWNTMLPAVLKGQGYKMVTFHVIWNRMISGQSLPNMNTQPCINPKLQVRLKLAHRQLDSPICHWLFYKES